MKQDATAEAGVWLKFFHEALERKIAAERDMKLARRQVAPKIIVVENWSGQARSVLKEAP
jgi:hypothetical protein